MPPRPVLARFAVPAVSIAALLAACAGAGESDPTSAQATAQETTETEARVTYEYHDEFGHGHCAVTELASAGDVVLCVARADRETRIACFTREEAAGSRKAMGLLRVNGAGEVTERDDWPAECAEALEAVAPGSDLNEQAGA